MRMKLTRRQLAAAVLAPAAIDLSAQAPPRLTAAQELAAARDRLKANIDGMARVAVPQATEPAFQFKV